MTYKTAWRMGNEIRKHMGAVDGDAELGGAGVFVEIDETVVGGIQSVEERAPGGTNKTIVLGMMERGGDLVTVVVSNQKRATLMPHIVKHVDGDSIVHTYENPSYNLLRDKGYDHYSVNHRVREHSARTARRSIASKTSGGT